MFLKISQNSQEKCQGLFFNKVPDLRLIQNSKYFAQAVTDFSFSSAGNTKSEPFLTI